MSDEKRESKIKVENLPNPEKELTQKEAEEVSGGGSIPPVDVDLLGVVHPQGRRGQEQNKVVVDPNNPNTIY